MVLANLAFSTPYIHRINLHMVLANLVFSTSYIHRLNIHMVLANLAFSTPYIHRINIHMVLANLAFEWGHGRPHRNPSETWQLAHRVLGSECLTFAMMLAAAMQLHLPSPFTMASAGTCKPCSATLQVGQCTALAIGRLRHCNRHCLSHLLLVCKHLQALKCNVTGESMHFLS